MAEVLHEGRLHRPGRSALSILISPIRGEGFWRQLYLNRRHLGDSGERPRVGTIRHICP